MKLTLAQQRHFAKAFAQEWKGRGDEKQETQKFWLQLLHDVYGIESPTTVVAFEKRVKLEGSTRFIDAYIQDTRVIVEQKSLGVDLSKEGGQSGGDSLTPYNQARRYDNNLPLNEKARWIVCCNFESFEVHDMLRPLDAPEVIFLKDLERDFPKLQFIADVKVNAVRREEEISVAAGNLVRELYDMIRPQYRDPDNAETLRSLNQLCVRLVFCLYAEDTALFGEKDKFYNYLKEFNPGQFRKALIELFKVFNTPYEERDAYMDPNLVSFPFIRGGIFTDDIEIPLFTPEIIEKLLVKASLEVDWSDINPTIFGAVFESTLNPETRRKGGMHYTSVENIHKVIDPLFLDDLRKELDGILAVPVKGRRDKELNEYQSKLAGLKFLDPACGSGNFLTETYLSLRRLENRALEAMGVGGQLYLGEDFSPIKVRIDQFYGIEINDFAVSVARTALWIAEAQMLRETEHIVGKPLEFFPLKENPNIVEDNALRKDWNDVVPAGELNYIMGNPPFVGARMMDDRQKDDVLQVFGAKWKNVGNLDYVCCWYRSAANYIYGTDIRCALVSTNSITQGEQVADLWKPLVENLGIHIDFAWRTFRWDSEASIKAHVHCVIVGFSSSRTNAPRIIYQTDAAPVTAENISPYLVDSSNVFIVSRSTPICEVPGIGIGNKPIDGGNFLFTSEEKDEFIRQEPASEPYFREWYGSEEFIHRQPRYCLWLGDCSPAELHKMPLCLKRVEAVRNYRLASTSAGTVKLADRPTRFHVENMPKSNYVVIPEVSSEKRKYVPMGYMSPDVMCSNLVKLVPGASLYHFGILTSSVHMSWMRAVCGRLKSDYRYSKDIVYNNFPWPAEEENPEQPDYPVVTQARKTKIEQTARAILDARSLYPDCSLADLYDDLTMPIELRRAHQANDRAVMDAYGFDKSLSESDIVAALFTLYRKLTEKLQYER